MSDGRFVGAWDLVEYRFVDQGGHETRPFGADAIGRVVYTDGGHVSAQVMRAGRPRFGRDRLGPGTSEEAAAAFRSYLAFFGTYRVERDEGVVVHHVLGSLFPNWVGADQRRYFRFDGDELTLSMTPIGRPSAGPTATLVWRRAR